MVSSNHILLINLRLIFGSGLFVSDADARPSFLEHEWRELANFTNEKRRNSRHSLIREIRVEDRHLLCATT